MNIDTMNVSVGLHPVAARRRIFFAFILNSSSVNGVTEAQLAGLTEHIIRIDIAD